MRRDPRAGSQQGRTLAHASMVGLVCLWALPSLEGSGPPAVVRLQSDRLPAVPSLWRDGELRVEAADARGRTQVLRLHQRIASRFAGPRTHRPWWLDESPPAGFDATGGVVWEAGLALAAGILCPDEAGALAVRGRTVVELGSGTGLVRLLLALHDHRLSAALSVPPAALYLHLPQRAAGGLGSASSWSANGYCHRHVGAAALDHG